MASRNRTSRRRPASRPGARVAVPSVPEQKRRWSPVAIAGSIGIHLALLLFLWHVRPSPPPPTHTQVTFTLQSRPPPTTPPPVTQQQHRPEPPPAQAPRQTPQPAPPQATVGAQPQPTPPNAPLPPNAPPTPAPPSAPSPGTIDLFSHNSLQHQAAEEVHRRQQEEAARNPPDAGISEHDLVYNRINGQMTEQLARSQAQNGVYDSSFAELGRAIRDSWNPDRNMTKDVLKELGQNFMDSMREWHESGKRYAATGSPYADPSAGNVRSARPVIDNPNGTPGGDWAQEMEVANANRNGSFTSGVTAHVLVEEKPSGITVTLQESSGDTGLDKTALQDVRAALEQLRKNDPSRVKHHRKSLWSMNLQVVVNPPLPMVGLSFDFVTAPPQLELPLQRHLLKSVQIEAVYEDDSRDQPASHTPG